MTRRRPVRRLRAVRRTTALRGGRRARRHGIQAAAAPPWGIVIDVSFSGDGVVVTVRLRRRRRVCSTCGQTGRLEIHGRRVKRWRHLDLAGSRSWIECELRLLRCRDCGVRLEAVPWARAGARHSRDFEDTVTWLAQQMAFSPITRLLRVGWRTVGTIVEL